MAMEKRGQRNHHPVLHRQLRFHQRAANMLTKYVGSWTFIFVVLLLIAAWITTNAYLLVTGWDHYPFILLNFILSCLAALQAPIILMSQNRAAEQDRLMAKYDYQVNRKAEREIAELRKDMNIIKSILKKNILKGRH